MKFLADDMLGRLAKWLRILGYDTLYLSATPDEVLMRRALAEKRVLLTQDQELAQKMPGTSVLLIRNNRYFAQLQEVSRSLKLKIHSDRLFSLCLECNIPVTQVAKKTVQKDVPSYAYQNHRIFWKCSHCAKVYWRGSHYDNTLKKLQANR